MKKTFFVLLAGFLFLVLTAGDCKKASGPSDFPTVPSVTFSSPGTQDLCSQQAYFIVQSANEYTAQFALFAALQPNANGSEYTWQVTIDTLTISVKATRQGDGSFTWEVRYDGTENGITYTNKLIATGTTSSDGKSGDFSLYDDVADVVVGTFSFSTSGSNVLTGLFTEYDTFGVQSSKIDLTSNPDGSGTVATSDWNGTAWVQTFSASWASAGAQATCV